MNPIIEANLRLASREQRFEIKKDNENLRADPREKNVLNVRRQTK